MDEADLERSGLEVGDARYMISLPMKGRFCDPRFFANPFVLSLLELRCHRRCLKPGSR